jgi:ABC-type transport system involved in cytochrome c biogenesis permease component
MLPVVAPVLIAGTEAFSAAYAQTSGEGWKWCGLLAIFAVLYLVIGIFAFEPLLEES